MQKYQTEGKDTIILAGAEYGSGSSRDWAAKGPMLLVSLLILSDDSSFSIHSSHIPNFVRKGKKRENPRKALTFVI